MQKNVLISVVFFSFLGAVPAQEINIEVQVIIDDGQEKHPGSVYLQNPRLEITRFTDNKGKAEMPVICGDLLYITSDFYEDRSFLITEKLREKWGDAYFSEELHLPFPKIREFIFFVIETTNITELTAQNKFTEAEALLAEKSREYLFRSEPLISDE